jgi:hypothetical protein
MVTQKIASGFNLTKMMKRIAIQYSLTIWLQRVQKLDILGVGGVRGGGLSNMNRTFAPNLAIGVDLSKNAIKFCNKKYTAEKIKRFQPDAQKLDFAGNAFVGVVNHRIVAPLLKGKLIFE